MKRSLRACASIAVLSASAGCDTRQNVHPLDLDLNRMLQQPRTDPYEAESFFADHRAMQTPPAGTVPRSRMLGPPLVTQGYADGNYAQTIPVPITRATLAAGRERFDFLCATCHGILGDAVSPVATQMTLRRPPSLHELRLRAYPPGRLYQVIQRGYGLMASYSWQLGVDERWAVVAYVRALQRSQWAIVSELPPAIQSELARRAP